MPDVNQGQVASVAWENLMSDGPTDNILQSHNLLKAFKGKGNVNYADGGRLFEETVEYALNSTFRSVDELEELDTTRVDVFDCARYEQKIHAGTVVFSDLEKLRNAIANRKIDVVKAKLLNGTNSAMESLNGMLWGDGTGNSGKNFDGIQKHIPDTPTSGTVGGINAGTWTFWRSRALVGTKASTAYDTLRTKMSTVFNQCSIGGTDKRPTRIISGQTIFEAYKSLLVAIETLTKDSGGSPDADIEFDNDDIAFAGRPYGYDEQADPTDNVWFLNNSFIKLTILKGAWLKMKDAVEPANQLSAIHRVFTVGNLTSSARRHLGVVYDIT